MKGFVVVSSARNFLTYRRDEADGQTVISWTNAREAALRFASKKQAKQACEIYPLADATVEPAELFSKIEKSLLCEFVALGDEDGDEVTYEENLACESLEQRGFVKSVVTRDGPACDITTLGRIALRETLPA